MKRLITILMLASISLMMLTSCETPLHPDGRAVKFTARSNGASTKTAYSGENGGYAIIAWQDNDKIRIFSPKNADGVITGPSETVPDGSTFGYYFADYGLTDFRLSGHEHTASLKLAENNANGLTWTTAGGTTTFYSIYPTSVPINSSGSNLRAVVTIPNAQSGQINVAPQNITAISSLPLVAKQTANSGDAVNLRFDPAFSAFEFHLKSASGALTLNSFELSTASDAYITGTYYDDLTADDNMYVTGAASTQEENCRKAVSINFPAGTVINESQEVFFTLFALPVDLDQMTIKVNFTTASGNTKSRSLALKQNNQWIKFSAMHKARITGLALDEGGENWKLQVDDLEWTLVKKETTFSQNIQSGPFKISNARETGDNYYPEGTRQYQVRTLDMDGGKTFFEVEFTPQAPLGGYWQLIPESNGGIGTAAFQVEIWDDDEDQPVGTDLRGHIMNQPVKLHVKSNVTDAQRTEDHAIIIKAIFSTSITFDENSTFSADSEIQDVHKDGSFSYWRFVIPQKIN